MRFLLLIQLIDTDRVYPKDEIGRCVAHVPEIHDKVSQLITFYFSNMKLILTICSSSSSLFCVLTHCLIDSSVY